MNITLPRELVQQVLKVLEDWCNAFPDYTGQEDADAIESLQSTLSQQDHPEQHLDMVGQQSTSGCWLEPLTEAEHGIGVTNG